MQDEKELISFIDEHGGSGYLPAAPDGDAAYHDVRHVDLSTLQPLRGPTGHGEPQRAARGQPGQATHRSGLHRFLRQRSARGSADRRECVARQAVAPGVRLLVTPASQAVYRDAMRLGYLQDIADAGAVVTNSTCGACFGYHMGVVGPNEVCLTSSTRNFTG